MDPQTAHRARERAAAALELKRWDAAVAAATEALGADPGHYRAHGLLAQALLGKKEHVEAQRAAEAGLAFAPAQEWLHRLRSLALREQKRFAEALAAADEAVRLAPSQGYAHYTRALALSRLKRIPEARDACERAVKLDPTNADFRRDLGDLFLDSEPKTAETHYRASLALDASDAYALNNLGVALKRQGRAKEAVLAFKSAMILDPTLGAAKRNTHSTTQELLRTGSGIGLAVVLVNVVRIAVGGLAPGSSSSLALVALATVLAVGAAVVAVRALGRSKKSALSRLDPQLYGIFERLDADKKAGRL